MKSRGMKHSNQVREFVITDKGLQLVDVYLGPNGVLIGSAREEQQLEEAAGTELKSFAGTRREREIKRKRMVLDAKIASLNEEFESVKDELNRVSEEEDLRKTIMKKNRQELTSKRYLNDNKPKSKKGDGKGKK
jgi:circadian clock protein KaiC